MMMMQTTEVRLVDTLEATKVTFEVDKKWVVEKGDDALMDATTKC